MDEQSWFDDTQFVGGGFTAPRFEREFGGMEDDVSVILLRGILLQALELDIKMIKVERREPYKTFHAHFIQGHKVVGETIGPCFEELQQHLSTLEDQQTLIVVDKLMQEFLTCCKAPQDFINAMKRHQGKTYRIEVAEVEKGVIQIHLK